MWSDATEGDRPQAMGIASGRGTDQSEFPQDLAMERPLDSLEEFRLLRLLMIFTADWFAA